MSANNTKAEHIYIRAKRLLFASLVIAALGVSFFFLHSTQKTEEVPIQSFRTEDTLSSSPKSANSKHYIEGPEPSVFKIFTYKKDTPILVVEGACEDAYYAVLIYSKKIDYRESPLDARYNVASVCPSEKIFSVPVDLSRLPLVEGEVYYIIRAQQGKTGQWYNAY